MRKGICCAGNILVDITYPIDTWPSQGELAHITEGISMSTGGAVCNVVSDLARLDSSLPLSVSGYAGHDAEGEFVLSELGRYKNIDLSMIRRSGRTSFTAVMSNIKTKERTFFTYAGSTANYGQQDIDINSITADIFHIGYIMLLPELDKEDSEYGTKMARLLHDVQLAGIKTSLDVITESGDRFKKLVIPALRYTDYCIINELEAQSVTDIPLRDENGKLLRENLPLALKRLKEFGAKEWVVIHCPELGCGLDENDEYAELDSLTIPADYIKGTVGAGDAFCSGILYALESRQNIEYALKLASCTAAASLSSSGASEGVGKVEEVLKLFEIYN